MKTKKYLCIGDWVKSNTDADRHFISARRLPALYKVDPERCAFIDSDRNRLIDPKDYVVLRPDPTGKYIAPLN